MTRNEFLLAAFLATILGSAALAEPISVRHIQRPMHRFMLALGGYWPVVSSELGTSFAK
jgi:hypothetical protein